MPILEANFLLSAFPLVEGGIHSSSTQNMGHRRKNMPVASLRTISVELEFQVKVEPTGLYSMVSISTLVKWLVSIGVAYPKRARLTVWVDKLFRKGPARHVFSVATTQLCCREKTVGWVWPIGHSFLIPELYYKANIMLWFTFQSSIPSTVEGGFWCFSRWISRGGNDKVGLFQCQRIALLLCTKLLSSLTILIVHVPI